MIIFRFIFALAKGCYPSTLYYFLHRLTYDLIYDTLLEIITLDIVACLVFAGLLINAKLEACKVCPENMLKG